MSYDLWTRGVGLLPEVRSTRVAFFREIAENAAAGRKLSPEEWTELYRRHDPYMVGEPPPREPT